MPFFQIKTPSSKSISVWVKLFFPGFLMYRPSWIRSYLLIRPFLTLGPRPTGHTVTFTFNLVILSLLLSTWSYFHFYFQPGYIFTFTFNLGINLLLFSTWSYIHFFKPGFIFIFNLVIFSLSLSTWFNMIYIFYLTLNLIIYSLSI